MGWESGGALRRQTQEQLGPVWLGAEGRKSFRSASEEWERPGSGGGPSTHVLSAGLGLMDTQSDLE